MATKITREVIESALHCRYKGHLKLAGEQGNPSDYDQLMRESCERARQAAIAKVVVQHKENEVLWGPAVAPAVLRRGVSLLLDAVVEDEEFCVCFDVLQRVAGSSRFGDFHYIPVLFHGAEKPTRKLKALLELLGLVLGRVQGRQPGWGVLIYGRSGAVKRFRLKPNAQQTRRAMEAIKELQEAEAPFKGRVLGGL